MRSSIVSIFVCVLSYMFVFVFSKRPPVLSRGAERLHGHGALKDVIEELIQEEILHETDQGVDVVSACLGVACLSFALALCCLLLLLCLLARLRCLTTHTHSEHIEHIEHTDA
jgi:hypothetical protein